MDISTAHSILEDKQRIMTRYPYVFTDTDREVNGMAILAIEKQIPISVAKSAVNYICPKCKSNISIEFEQVDAWKRKAVYPNYCSHCGQALLWDHKKEKSGKDRE